MHQSVKKHRILFQGQNRKYGLIQHNAIVHPYRPGAL